MMDSEDELDMGYGGESDVEDLYDASEGEVDDYEEGFGEEDDDDKTLVPKKKSYTVLSEADVRQRQSEDIQNVSNVLSLSPVSAVVLLLNYNWSVTNVYDEWYADEQKVRKAIGLLENPVAEVPKENLFKCKICLEEYRCTDMDAVACGHLFCVECWTNYIRISISDGPGCLRLRCPEPSCKAAIGQDMVNKLVLVEDQEKYSRYLFRSYIEYNRKTKWCPAAGSDYAVRFDIGSDKYDVTCTCSYGFCWNCTEESHSPVDCDTVAKWIAKNKDESENTTWILANSKPCPKCKRPIEKNLGCMHMTCGSPCKYEFCWLCLGSWKDHNERTGGFYACNTYTTEEKEGKHDDEKKKQRMAKTYLKKYTHYYERWAANHKSREMAMANLKKMKTVELEDLSAVQCVPVTHLDFILTAWRQIIECRRVLKWTYAYGYYLPESEKAKCRLFQYLQGEAESGLERLHNCAEKELQVFQNAEGPSKEFDDFRTKLNDFTKITGNYFENLLKALENGLSDVNTQVKPGAHPQIAKHENTVVN